MDMAQRLEQIMGDDNAMAQIRQLAQSMGAASPDSSPTPSSSAASQGGGMDISGLMNMLASSGVMGGTSGGGDQNVQLLRALKPFLSKKRRKRVNEAVRLMQLVEMLPMLQQSGMLNGLMGGNDDE